MNPTTDSQSIDIDTAVDEWVERFDLIVRIAAAVDELQFYAEALVSIGNQIELRFDVDGEPRATLSFVTAGNGSPQSVCVPASAIGGPGDHCVMVLARCRSAGHPTDKLLWWHLVKKRRGEGVNDVS